MCCLACRVKKFLRLSSWNICKAILESLRPVNNSISLLQISGCLMLRGREGCTYWPFNGGTEKHFKHQGSVTAYLHFSALLKMLCGLTKLKIHILLAVLYPGCHKEAHIIRTPARHLEELSEDTPSLASIVTKVNSFDRRLDIRNIQLSIWVILSDTASAAETAVLAFLCVFLPFTLSLSWRHNQQVLIKKLNFFFYLLHFLHLFI